MNKKIGAFVTSYLFTAAFSMVISLTMFLGIPHSTIYFSSLIFPHYNNYLIIAAFTLFEFTQYITMWGAILFYSFLIVTYMTTVSALLTKLR